jgi:hypothetical protein
MLLKRRQLIGVAVSGSSETYAPMGLTFLIVTSSRPCEVRTDNDSMDFWELLKWVRSENRDLDWGCRQPCRKQISLPRKNNSKFAFREIFTRFCFFLRVWGGGVGGVVGFDKTKSVSTLFFSPFHTLVRSDWWFSIVFLDEIDHSPPNR